jgi:ABC-2 type transport system permease protein
MTFCMVRKLLRDVRLPLLVVIVLLAAFQCLWAKVTQRIIEEILPDLLKSMTMDDVLRIVFRGPGQILQALLGGEKINLMQAVDVLSIGYVHPLTQTILCVWAVGRASGAIAGEIDRGTMELLLAQPMARSRLILAHFGIDVVVIPLLCLSLWAGSWLGIATFGHVESGAPPALGKLAVNPMVLLPALTNVAALLFAVSGYSLWLSARGRFRWRVLGVAVLVTLVQFLVNVIGQLWDGVEALRPFTVFYYYQPQQIILHQRWTVELGQAWGLSRPIAVNVIAVLVLVGAAGYGLALWTFRRRDLPAPL